MKKSYSNPLTEAITINSAWAICQEASPENKGVMGGGGGEGGREMPRKPF